MLTPRTDSYASLEHLETHLIALGHTDYLDSTNDPLLEGHARQATLYLDHARGRGYRCSSRA